MKRNSPWWSLPILTLILTLTPPAWAQSASVVRGPYLQSPTPTSVVVRWRTDLPTSSRVRFGPAPGALGAEVSDPTPRLDHEVLISGLEPGTRYGYAVGSAAGDLAGGDGAHFFTTAPLPGERLPVRVWAFGDSGHRTVEQADVRDAYLAFTGARGTDVWLLLGDNAYEAGSDAEYQTQMFEPYAAVLRSTAVWSAFGNHERLSAVSEPEEAGAYYDLFTFPEAGEAGGAPSGREAYYSFDHGNVHFIALDSDRYAACAAGDPCVSDDGMIAWLEADLEANEREWTIAFFHHPPYSGGGHHSDGDGDTPDSAASIRETREMLLPLLETGGVDLVLAGHSHSFERSFLLDGHYGTSDTLTAEMILDGGDGRIGGDGAYRKTGDTADDAHSGTVYAVVGTGSEAFGVGPHPAMLRSINAPGSLVVDVDGPVLRARFLDHHGEVLDRFTIVRSDENLPPVATDDRAATRPETAITVDLLANDFDPDGDLLRIEALTAPVHGTVADLGDGRVTYTPAAGFLGGVDRFTYTVSDGAGHADTATVEVDVVCPEVETFTDDFEPEPEPGWRVVTAEDGSLVAATWAVREDPQAASPTRSWFSASDATTSFKDDRLISPPLDLTAASRLVFRHRYHTETRFDGGLLELSADGGVSWQDLGAAIVEGGYDDVLIGSRGTGRQAWTGVSAGEGMARVEVDLAAYAGPGRLLRWRLVADDFTPEATEGWWIDDVEVSAVVPAPGVCNLPPVAADDEAATVAGEAVEIDVLANDSDPNGDALAVAAVSAPASGSAEANAGGTVTYAPAPGFAGVDRFTYEVTDGELSASAEVTVTVEGEPAALSRARGNGDVDGAAGAARFAFHARLEDGRARGWLRYRGPEIELAGEVADLAFPTAESAEIEGPCWLADGSPCRLLATAIDLAHPGAGADRFAIEVRDDAGAVVHASSGVVLSGHVKLD